MMRVVETMSLNRTSWRLARLTYPDSRRGWHTGDDLSRATPRNQWVRDRYAAEGVVVELGPNVVVEAALEPSDGGQLRDRDGGLLYGTRLGDLGQVLMMLAAGGMRLEGGLIHGRFTFRNQSGVVCLAPVDPDAPGLADREAEGAPDVSDLVLALGKPGRA